MELPEARGADQNSPVVGVHSGGRRRCRGWTVCNGIAAEMGCSENQQEKCSESEEAPHLQPPKNSSTSLSPWNRYKTTERRVHWVDSDEELVYGFDSGRVKSYRIFLPEYGFHDPPNFNGLKVNVRHLWSWTLILECLTPNRIFEIKNSEQRPSYIKNNYLSKKF